MAGIAFCLLAITPLWAAQPDRQDRPVTGLELFDVSHGPASSPCGLGLVATGSPVTITRVSDDGHAVVLRESDRIHAIAGRPVRNTEELRNALAAFGDGDLVSLTVERDQADIELDIRCRDTTTVREARERALHSAARNEWNACIRATYDEEKAWGGSNSLSAGLRLWCHQARHGLSAGRTDLRPIDAQFLYEYVERMLVEMGHLPNADDDLKRRLESEADRIAAHGHPDLASALEALLVASSPP